jgi:hypothetical protein
MCKGIKSRNRWAEDRTRGRERKGIYNFIRKDRNNMRNLVVYEKNKSIDIGSENTY